MTEKPNDEELVEVGPEHVAVIVEPEPETSEESGFAVAEPKDPFFIDLDKNPALAGGESEPDLGALLAQELELAVHAVSARAKHGIAARAAITRAAQKAS